MPATPTDSRTGLGAAVAAYLIWGIVVPLYMKALADASAFEIIAHRVIWALPFAFLILMVLGRTGTIRGYLTPGMLGRAMLSAAVISVNWGVYVYAIATGRAVEAALGYFINPLVNIALGAIFLRERPTRAQGFAIALASAGVAIMAIEAGGLPWISLVLACTFATYGLLRKVMPFGPTEGLFLEVMVLTPGALAIIGYLYVTGGSYFMAGPWFTTAFVMLGPLTAIPLILFATGAKRLTLGTIGVLQYMVPTLLFLMAVFIFDEPFGLVQLVAFAFIWAALAIYTASLLRGGKRTGNAKAAR